MIILLQENDVHDVLAFTQWYVCNFYFSFLKSLIIFSMFPIFFIKNILILKI